MSKYIAVDRLKAKLDEHYRKYQSKYMETRAPYTQGLIDALDLAEQVIDSLQQEQPEVDLEKETEKYFNGWTETDDGIACHYQYVDLNTCRGIARHFYELGKLDARKEE